MSNPPSSILSGKHRPRSSSLSLSIARSPSVLSSGLFFPPPSTSTPTANDDIELEIQTHPNVYGVHQYNPVRRVLSAGANRILDPILSEEDLPSLESAASSSTPHLSQYNDHSFSNRRGSALSGGSQGRIDGDNSNLEEEEEEYDHNDTSNSKPLLSRKVMLSGHNVSPTAHALSRTTTRGSVNLEYENSDNNMEYDGPFQPPDSKELLSIMLSIGGVIILAIAAGCTTIFDWVL
ncbi:uncharacterized protein IL334_007341 [Kwoniella shivajii]|uniref:Uncharacterized protein n=1 Tax=Kwoniella shivajii TaxID=564305 RepID=A0ABZ1D8E0_9TREE|nr:hypothetical protein IL334_007341 [Kwoniella shivajii]